MKAQNFSYQKTAQQTWKALLDSGVFVEGEFTFASGQHATLKADAEKLYDHPRQLETILNLYASHPCIVNADVLLYVPDGMRKFTHILGERLNKPVIDTVRNPNATTKYDFVFKSDNDKKRARTANTPVICEDIVTTLGSVAAIRRLLRPDQPVNSLAILLRGTVNPSYQQNLTDHYLLIKEIPSDKEEFQQLLREDISKSII